MQAGDIVEWSWHNYPNHSEIKILEANGVDQFRFTFGAGMEVMVSIETEDQLTVLILTQYNIPIDDQAKMNYFLGCSQAWSTWMLNLKSWLEHGLLLHDTSLGKREDLFHFVNT